MSSEAVLAEGADEVVFAGGGECGVRRRKREERDGACGVTPVEGIFCHFGHVMLSGDKVEDYIYKKRRIDQTLQNRFRKNDLKIKNIRANIFTIRYIWFICLI